MVSEEMWLFHIEKYYKFQKKQKQQPDTDFQDLVWKKDGKYLNIVLRYW